ncbi:hypothetical protein NC652_018524 [Populus alba x Populus x berolinensis]|nr:hypothetical protein NC652_018518 [Populus alba x Populus x berolinensis]KAJ6915889.1 hypothetical protein NC652_018524 [Populus alba x Populus x berolinensis]
MWYERKKTGKGMSWAGGVVEDDKNSGGSFLEESDSECWRDGRAGIEEGSKEKEGNFVVFTVIFFRNKINEAKKPKPVLREKKSVFSRDSLIHFSHHSYDMKDFTNLEAKAQTEVDLIVSPGGNAKFVQGAGAPSMSQSTNGRSNSKENEGKEVQGNCLLQRERTELQN